MRAPALTVACRRLCYNTAGPLRLLWRRESWTQTIQVLVHGGACAVPGASQEGTCANASSPSRQHCGWVGRIVGVLQGQGEDYGPGQLTQRRTERVSSGFPKRYHRGSHKALQSQRVCEPSIQAYVAFLSRLPSRGRHRLPHKACDEASRCCCCGCSYRKRAARDEVLGCRVRD